MAAAIAEIRGREGQKVVLYCDQLKPLDDFAGPGLSAAGIRYVQIDGNAGNKQRVDAVTAFRAPAGPRVILGTKAIERGVNLQNARVLISIATSWNPAREAQREGRICRIGSAHATYEHVVFLPDAPLFRAHVDTQQRKAAHAAVLFEPVPAASPQAA